MGVNAPPSLPAVEQTPIPVVLTIVGYTSGVYVYVKLQGVADKKLTTMDTDTTKFNLGLKPTKHMAKPVIKKNTPNNLVLGKRSTITEAKM